MLNKLLLSAAFVFLMNINAEAQQNFTLEHDTVYANGNTADFEVVGEVDFTNNTNANLTLRWRRTQNTMTAGWASALCYLGGTCFAPSVDSATFVMAANATSGFSFHFMTNNTIGAGTATILLYQPGSPANAQKTTFIVNSYTVGTTDAPSIGTLTTYPNPAQNQLNIRTPEANGTLILWDMQGREITRQANAELNAQMNIENLPQGIYTLQFVGKKYRAAQRIEKI